MPLSEDVGGGPSKRRGWHGSAGAWPVGDLVARATTAGLFLMLSVRLLDNFLQTGRVTGLLLLASELLVVVLTIARRRTDIVDRSRAALWLTALSIAGPPLLKTTAAGGLLADSFTAACSAVGLLVVVAAKLTLGRSFGVAPANRGIVGNGPYAIVRHPIYAGYLVTHVAFIVANPLIWNVIVLACADAALVGRALVEERLLAGDASYRRYCNRVAWHVLPGVF